MMLRIKRYVPLTVGALLMWVGTRGLLEFQRLPEASFTRRCGNCWHGAAWVSIELCLMGALLAAGWMGRVEWKGRRGEWLLATAGVWLTPMIIGVPMFVLAWAQLAFWVIRRYRRGQTIG